MIFAILLADGAKEPGNCPGLDDQAEGRLEEYLAQFQEGPESA